MFALFFLTLFHTPTCATCGSFLLDLCATGENGFGLNNLKLCATGENGFGLNNLKLGLQGNTGPNRLNQYWTMEEEVYGDSHFILKKKNTQPSFTENIVLITFNDRKAPSTLSFISGYG